jgi:hypothetical protein
MHIHDIVTAPFIVLRFARRPAVGTELVRPDKRRRSGA